MSDRPERRHRRSRAVAAVLVVVSLLVAVVPPLRARAVAVPTTAGALDLPWPRPLAVDVRVEEVTLGGVPTDRYGRSGAADPPVVLVPGATPEGRDDARVIALARSVARSGRTVIVPELRVYEPTLVPEDVDRIAAVIAAADRSVTLVGISYGGSLALRALGDHPDLQERVELVVVFGAYGDLVGVIQGTATGSVLLGDEAFAWEPEPEAERILRQELLDALPPDVAGPARAALAGDRPVADLSEEAAAVVELLTHDDPERTPSLVAALPSALRERLRAVSPVHVADGLHVPVRILHARDDPAVPYAEGRRLVSLLPDARLTTVRSFDHVDLELGSPRELAVAVRDLLGVWRLVGALLAAQEPWLPARAR